MRKIYSNPDTSVVHLVKIELEKRGIEAVVRGEHLAMVGVPMEAWGELWLMDEDRLEEATQIVRGIIESAEAEDGNSWTCPECGEEGEPELAVCWNCGNERPEVAKG